MFRRNGLLPLPLLASAALLAACKGAESSVGPSESAAMRRTDVVDMMSAMNGALVNQIMPSTAARKIASDVALRTLAVGSTQTGAETFACPEGGSISITPEPGSVVALTAVHRGCRAKSETGRVWTIDGDPDLNVRLTIGAIGDTTVTFTLNIKGAVRVAGPGKSGRCGVDYSTVTRVTRKADGTPAISNRVAGTACGERVDDSF